MSNKKLLIGSISIVSVIILLLVSILVIIKYDNNETKQTEKEIKVTEVTQVKNRNDFFTVANCIEKYINYLTTKEADILYEYLDKEYIEEKNITKSNVLNKINTLEDYYKFKARKMYVAEISDMISQYFVYGTLTLEATGDDEKETKLYISVKVDRVNNTFSIIPDKYIDNMTIK